MKRNTISWIARIVIVLILAMPAFMKLSGDAMPVAMFEKLGLGDFGRIGAGLLELLAVILLLIPKTKAIGAALALGSLTGAIIAHLTVLGIVIDGDASLFGMAVVGAIAALVLLSFHKEELPIIGKAA